MTFWFFRRKNTGWWQQKQTIPELTKGVWFQRIEQWANTCYIYYSDMYRSRFIKFFPRNKNYQANDQWPLRTRSWHAFLTLSKQILRSIDATLKKYQSH